VRPGLRIRLDASPEVLVTDSIENWVQLFLPSGFDRSLEQTDPIVLQYHKILSSITEAKLLV
jgi:hypothetical protein